ncbi:MAG: 1-acyl-sn-glycerol-3-phosphate acyltransferase [Chloroflexi bacterium]|nr:1-acyl-sn-glycerol-3-phosphate acyltransferase [Chloroflexota bacterium]MDK1044529.1 lysophospholipid acyltransferase family protein [Anaerolineales bacterium]MCH8095382.1 1-acyl-sn-glycerol-3-phosphate acyltransferase [Chloroflexota bacterium]MCH8340202.1 1-acyl-sn-glycerol-3-phosphate acyltransferase [Chloroflexota bacterium]MCI0772844.1 1-acyl-sn-glycerol-3-phosphate acyltransferase [Chloroflexota bacterium]
MLNRLMRGMFFVLINLLSRPNIEGRENLPKSGAYLIVSNHMSMVDIPMGLTFFGRRDLKAWVAAKWSSHPLLAPIVHMSGGIFIVRGKVDRSALQEAINWLKSGRPFVLAPEGTRSRQGTLQRGKTGAAYLAAEANVPVIPTGFIGTDEAMRTLFRRFRRPRITLRIGKPFMLPPLDGNSQAASLRKNTDELMCRIAVLLPRRYWGHYADHPRLQELLEQEKGGSPAAEDTGSLDTP